MKLLLVKCFVLFIRILYAPMKLRKTQNKILYLSRQANEKTLDFILLEKAVQKENPKVIQVFRMKRLRDESSLNISYIFSVFGDMWELASAKIVVLDSYSIPACCLTHKKGTEIIQIWHALGGIKKSGLQSVGKAQGRDEGVSKALCMHRGYTRLLAPSKASAEFFKVVFGCNDENTVILSLPRVDILLDGKNRREEFIKLNPEFRGKVIVSYIPTFRNNDEVFAKDVYESFKNREKYKLIISAHPLSETARKGEYKYNGSFTSEDFIKLSDIVISDYSACSYEAAILEKPLYFYVPDYEVYSNEVGINVDIKAELPDCAFSDVGELLDALENKAYNKQRLIAFGNKYVENQGTDNAKKLAEYILSLIK